MPLHPSLVRPILLGGGERELVVIEVSLTLSLVLGLGLHPVSVAIAVLVATVGHRLLVWIARQDPQATRVYARHRRYQPFYPAAALAGAGLARVARFREGGR